MSPCSCAATTATSQVTASTKQRFLALSNSDRRLCYAYNLLYISSCVNQKEKKKQLFLAESVGFEPTVRCRTLVFKTSAFDRSANSPYWSG